MATENEESRFKQTLTRLDDLSLQQDPPETPFKSKYAARAELLSIYGDLNEKLRSVDGEERTDLEENRAVIDYRLGTNYVQTEEFGDGMTHLNKCVDVLCRAEKKYCCELIDSMNHIALVDSSRENFQKSLEILQKAENVYDSVGGEGRAHRLEELHTLTLFYMAQAYSQIGDSAKAASYCHRTLERQVSSGEFDSQEWSNNCLRLTDYYMLHGNFRQVWHCLQAAKKMAKSGDDEDSKQLRASISQQWGDLCVERLKRSSCEETEAGNEKTIESGDNEVYEPFEALSLSDPDPCGVVKTLEQAEDVLTAGQTHFQDALEFFKLDGFVSGHVAIQLGRSNLLKYFAQFQKDLPKQIKTHRKRVNFLEPLIKEINPQYYGDQYREITCEVASAYSDMGHIKTQVAEESASKRTSTRNKINSFLLKAYSNYSLCISSMETTKSTDNCEGAHVETSFRYDYLMAKFARARLYSHMVAGDIQSTVSNLRKSLGEYEEIISFCKKHSVAEFQDQLKMCTELCTLLPVKIERLIQCT
eukprot:80246_1